MKPDWKDAPEWANYLAMDSDGDWFWYEVEPQGNDEYQHINHKNNGRMTKVNFISGWESTVEKRP